MKIRQNNISRVYIHVPFCRVKCDYCTFHSIPSPTKTDIERYLGKLEQDIKTSAPNTSKLRSLYIGGGTPSYIPTELLSRLFQIIRANFTFSSEAEITVECNPDTLTSEKIKIISEHVNRISIGIQTLNKNHQKTIGRITELSKLEDIMSSFHAQNITNLSCDLIFGIPGQTNKNLQKDMETVVQLPFRHISAYFLTFEEGSALTSKYSKKNISSFEHETAYMLKSIPKFLKKNGFARYEISNYAKPGYECSHNYEIWYGDRYMGFGPTASSFVKNTRTTEKDLDKWQAGATADIDIISDAERTREIIIMGLRTIKGWIIDRQREHKVRVSSHLGNDLIIDETNWEPIYDELKQLAIDKLIEIVQPPKGKHTKICPTEKGLLFWDEIGMRLLL